VADRQYAKDPRAAVEVVHDAITPDAVPPLSLELTDERRTLMRIRAQRSQCSSYPTLQIRREMTDDIGNVWWDCECEAPLTAGHAS